jgi:hypothetical protein
MNPRAGLKRYGMRAYLVAGPSGAWIIERDRPYRFFVKRQDGPAPYGDFFAFKFNRLGPARRYAEHLAGILQHCDDYPYSEVPVYLRRWKPKQKTA